MKLSYAQLKVYVASVIADSKTSVASFVETRDNTVDLLDKIGKIITLDTNFRVDKLARFDGEYLSFGKSIEEYQIDLTMPEDKDESGANALSPHRPSVRPAFYSYTTGKKVIPTTIDYNDIERAVHFESQLVEIVSMKYKRLEDSMAVYRYNLKRQMIASFYSIAASEMSGSASKFGSADADDGTWGIGTYPVSTGWATAMGEKAVKGLYVLLVSGGTGSSAVYNGSYIAVKNISATETDGLDDLVANGSLIKLDLITEISKPVDTSTGEAFIQQVQEDVEVASDLSEGHSLNGNTLGATEGLVLIVKQGVLPVLNTTTWAGAFHKELLALPAETIVVKDFGNCDEKVYAVLMDARAMRLHNTANATYENLNGEGAFLNIFRHTEDTAWISRNAFVKFYKES